MLYVEIDVKFWRIIENDFKSYNSRLFFKKNYVLQRMYNFVYYWDYFQNFSILIFRFMNKQSSDNINFVLKMIFEI